MEEQKLDLVQTIDNLSRVYIDSGGFHVNFYTDNTLVPPRGVICTKMDRLKHTLDATKNVLFKILDQHSKWTT